MNIEIAAVSKCFGSFVALRDVQLRLKAGELLVLLGSVCIWENHAPVHHSGPGVPGCR